jgi:hypothetical protein
MVLACTVAIGWCQVAFAQRPEAARILPETTVAAVRIADMPQLVSRFRETALGKIGQDPKVQPLVSQLYRSAAEEFKRVEEQIGLPLDQLLAVPQGELCLAIVAMPDEKLRPALILDSHGNAHLARQLLVKLEAQLGQRGWTKETERLGKQEATVYVGGPDHVYLVEREGTFVFAFTRDLMSMILARWDDDAPSLAETDKYTTIMTRCGSRAPDAPQITWYVDPIEIFRYAARGTWGVTALALLPTLGLDGLQAAGGSITFSSGEFDDVQHIHVLTAHPRTAVLDALALDTGDTTAESWVPGDCLSYSTIHWDLKRTFFTSARVYNGIMGEGQLEGELRTRFSEPLGADLIKEIMPELTGRGTYVQWVERPIKLNSVTTLVGLQLKDPDHFRPTLNKIVQKHTSRLEKQRYGEFSYWLIGAGDDERAVRRQQKIAERPLLRQPKPCFGIVGDTLLFTDSLTAYQEAIATQADPNKGLAASLDFKLIASKLKRQPGGETPGLLQFKRPEEGLRLWYDLANSDNAKERLAARSQGNPFFKSLDQALKDNPLPPFETLAEYLASGGGILVSDNSGFHYTTFTLKRK